jgi:hypothetical protein
MPTLSLVSESGGSPVLHSLFTTVLLYQHTLSLNYYHFFLFSTIPPITNMTTPNTWFDEYLYYPIGQAQHAQPTQPPPVVPQEYSWPGNPSFALPESIDPFLGGEYVAYDEPQMAAAGYEHEVGDEEGVRTPQASGSTPLQIPSRRRKRNSKDGKNESERIRSSRCVYSHLV